ncbi:lytic murein transglycosylase B [Serratia microhaemolytica]|uniref:lytic murein transglycosylase B n=1 Tax=Serratia microhaemolytica TaxID=2675110 RepID=UPI000FDDB7D7|nr:lytic murein transglycosylase B [Serratia microhaemolytica]
MRYLVTLFPMFFSLVACAAEPDAHNQMVVAEQSVVNVQPSSADELEQVPQILTHWQQDNARLTGDFADNPRALAFIDQMVAKHSFERSQLNQLLTEAKHLERLIQLMDKQAPGADTPGPNGAWVRYRNNFLTPDNINNGVQFWKQHQAVLARAEKVYGVPAEIIVGIIGVETRWGKRVGNVRVIDALSTLSFNYPRRAEFFSGELETFLLMARKQGDDPLSWQGSFAGAVGYPQFMPSSIKRYAVDFDGDGQINLWQPVDAIGSVANYLREHGWKPGALVAVPARGKAPKLESGYQTKYSVAKLKAAGLEPKQPLKNSQQVSLLRLDMGKDYQYWFGLPNFYTLTRYNRSVHYAMAVWQLGEAVNKARH